MATSKPSNRPLIGVAIFLICLMVIVGIAVAAWQASQKDNDDDGDNSCPSSFEKYVSYSVGLSNVTLKLTHESHVRNLLTNLSISLAVNVSTESLNATDDWTSRGHMTLQWGQGSTVDVRKWRGDDQSMSCLTVNWTMGDGEKETMMDCIDISGSFWFGGFEESYQHWPISDLTLPMSAYVTGDAFNQKQIGDVVEPLLVSSSGFGIYVPESVPLYISFNHPQPGQLCLKGKTSTGGPFFTNDPPTSRSSSSSSAASLLVYHVCRASDVTRLWKEMARTFISKPRDIPSPSLFRFPIWSTWAMYKGYINQTSTLEYANDILSNGFGISQLEIDDNWTPTYGNFTFDLNKFPDARSMISELTSKGIPVTVWVHPFFNKDSMTFRLLTELGFLVKDENNRQPALTSWWRGDEAGILDVSNPEAVEWYLKQMETLKEKFNVTSFKFDAGEVNWLPKAYTVQNSWDNPNEYSKLFANMSYLADTKYRRQETRVGFKTQELPILVRMIDRDSTWSHEKGLKSMIPTALTLSMMGYPFVLPDMIGGNAYDPDDLDKTVLPDSELFVRWLQVSTFMPVLQFSVAPWVYNDETILNISRKYVNLHYTHSDAILSLARHAVASGEPILRPLWWIAPNDPEACIIDSEFLLGDELLVAPVLEKGATSRDVYLPKGRWRHGDSGNVYSGPLWLRNFSATLEELPYFWAL